MVHSSPDRRDMQGTQAPCHCHARECHVLPGAKLAHLECTMLRRCGGSSRSAKRHCRGCKLCKASSGRSHVSCRLKARHTLGKPRIYSVFHCLPGTCDALQIGTLLTRTADRVCLSCSTQCLDGSIFRVPICGRDKMYGRLAAGHAARRWSVSRCR